LLHIRVQRHARTRAAFFTNQRRERESLPLFADQIEEERAARPDVGRVMQEWAESRAKYEQEWRAHRAGKWRKKLWLYDGKSRLVIRNLWNDALFPATLSIPSECSTISKRAGYLWTSHPLGVRPRKTGDTGSCLTQPGPLWNGYLLKNPLTGRRHSINQQHIEATRPNCPRGEGAEFIAVRGA
jgi:hypothetical protein